MSDQFIDFTTDKQFVQCVRELKTIEVMILMYCACMKGQDIHLQDCS